MTPEQQRAHLVNSMLTRFTNNVFKQRKIKKLKEMAKLAVKNMNLRQSPAACFMFGGTWYTNPWNAEVPKDTSELDRTLDPSLHGEAAKIFYDDDFETKKEETQITHMLRSALAECASIAELEEIIPTELWDFPHWLKSEFHLFDDNQRTTATDLDAFRQRHQEGFDALRKLFMIDLLMAKVTE